MLRPRRLGRSPTAVPSCCISREGAPTTPPHIGMPTVPQAVFYRSTHLVNLLPRAHSTAPYIGNAHAASGGLLPAREVSCISQKPPLNAFLPLHPYAIYGQFLAHPGGTSPVKGACHTSLRRQHPRRLRASPDSGPGWCIFRDGPLHASIHRHAHAASDRLLPAHLVDASTGRKPLPRLPTSAKPKSPQFISYRRTQ